MARPEEATSLRWETSQALGRLDSLPGVVLRAFPVGLGLLCLEERALLLHPSDPLHQPLFYWPEKEGPRAGFQPESGLVRPSFSGRPGVARGLMDRQ